MAYILDNSPDRKVITTIEKLIAKSKEANFAVGYFFLSGWNLIKDKLPEDMKKGFFKILIGRELDFPTFKEISTGYKLRIQTKLLEDLSGELSNENIKNLTELYHLIQDGYADFKVFTEGKLHSKLYLFINNPSQLEDSEEFTPGAAIVGSSNFTRRGTEASKELNTRFTDREQVIYLYKWFYDLWDNHSEDFKDDLIEIIKYSNALSPRKKNPFGIYISPKTLFKYLTWIWLKGRIDPIEKEDILAQFQLVGVLNAIEIISEFNGCIIADSVGLGKSFIGAALIEEYITGNLLEWDPKSYGINKPRKVLLILPPALIKQWRHLLFKSGDFFSKTHNVKLETENRIVKYQVIGDNYAGEVHFLSLGKFGMMSPETIYSSEFHKDYDLILIDEAHKFRNRATNRWNNAKALRFKEEDDQNSFRNKFIFLTATPINNNIWDIYNLIKIFSDNNFTNFKRRNIQLTKLFMDYRDIKIKMKEDDSLEKELAVKAQEIKDGVFKKVIILRTRKYIMDSFGENGKINIRGVEYSFKDPIPDKITYSRKEKKFVKYYEFLESLEELFEDLEFTFIKLYSSGYVAFSEDKAVEEGSKDSKIMVLIGGILKFLLVKRLESSIFAFDRTLTKLLIKNELFLKTLIVFINKVKNLNFSDFLNELKEFSSDCIKIAKKEDAIKDFEEDDVDLEEGRIDPRLRLIINLLTYDNEEIIQTIKNSCKVESDFYDYCDNTDELDLLISSLKVGLNAFKDELVRDKRLMTNIKVRIDDIKLLEQSGMPLIVGEFSGDSGKVKIPVYDDPKFQQLKDLIYDDINEKKFIIFTQYRDTAYYIYKNLLNWAKNQQKTLTYLFSKEGLKIEIVTGSLNQQQKENLIERFAPIANNSKQYLRSDIEILVSTDSLSEGVNLQDADGVVNYDLPWNPMKIVQRVGRVNRIGNERDVIVKNFIPGVELNAIIGILEKLSSKIKDITYLVGKEFYILSEEEEIKHETFEKKINDLAGAKLSELEKLSQTGDAKYLTDFVQQEEIEKFKLLNFIQAELKLRKHDFDEIQQYIDKKKTLYTLTKNRNLFRVYELYRGTTKANQYILTLEGKEVKEATCKVFKNLWNAEEHDGEFNVKMVHDRIKTLDLYFEREIMDKYTGMIVQKGFLKKLLVFLRQQKQHKTLDEKGIDRSKIIALVDYLPLVEMHTRDIGDFKKHLIEKGAIDKNENIKPDGLPILINEAYAFLNPGSDTNRRLYYKVLGWEGP